MLRLLTWLFGFLVSVVAFCQPQNTQRFHQWHFGDNWTLDFSSGSPVVGQSTSINTQEGCASLADGAGNLLFYTDGVTVYQRNNSIMPNGAGLLGDNLSTMSAIITPVIGNRNQYYIFTVDGTTTSPNNGPGGRFDGLHYSVVDMSLNGGFGQVIQKNIPLADSTTEKVIALKGANDREYWIVTQLWNKSRYLSFKVDCSGIQTIPVSSFSGLPVSGTISYGFMKPSHDGNRIASVVTDTAFFGLPERVEVLDFNRLTGQLSNPQPVTGTGSAYYGLEWSPDNQTLYVGDITNQEIKSYDMTAGNIPATQQIVHDYGLFGIDVGALQLGPNNKIYIKRFDRIDVINNPNNRASPGFQLSVINLPNPSIFFPTLGLPAWFDIWPPPLSLPDTSICWGYSTPIGVDPLPGFSYQWSPAGTLNSANIANPIATPVATTTYTLNATFAGCTDTAFVTVRVIGDSMTITSNLGMFNYCPNRLMTLTVNNAIPIQWLKDGSPIPGTPNSTTVVTGPGVYQAIVTDSCGHPDTLFQTISLNPPVATITPSDTALLCPGSARGLLAGGGTVVQWQRNGIALSSTAQAIIANQTGTYSVIVEDTCGLRDTASMVMLAAPQPTITVIPGDTVRLCPGSTDTLRATGGTPIRWRRNGVNLPLPADSFLIVSQTGRYQIVMANALGCTDTATIQVVAAALPATIITSADTAICRGDTVQLSTIPGTVLWSGTDLSCLGCNNPVAVPANTTTYQVLFTTNDGCIAADSILITVLSLPQVTISGDTAMCSGDSLQLTASGASSYQWIDTTGSLTCTLCPNPVATPTSNAVYTITGTDANGCQNTTTKAIQVNALPALSVTGNALLCPGSSVSLTASGAASYLWLPASGLSCTTCPTVTASPGTNTTYTLVGTSTSGCTDTLLVPVQYWGSATPVRQIDSIICPGDTAFFTYSSAGIQSIRWLPAGATDCDTCFITYATPSVTTTYTVLLTSTQGCQSSDSFTVSVVPRGILQVSNDTTICRGSLATLTASGGSSYQWLPGIAISCSLCPNPAVFPTQTTTYTVSALDNNGCRLIEEVNVQVSPGPSLQVFGQGTICTNDTLPLQATGAVRYQWLPATTLTCDTCANPGAFPRTSITYTVSGFDVSGCSTTDSISVTVLPASTITLMGDTAICRGDTASWQVTGAAQYFWLPNNSISCSSCPSPELWPGSTTAYTVIAVDSQGCLIDTSFLLTVESIPNVTVNLSSTSVCEGDTFQLTVTGALHYQWSPNQFLSCDTCDILKAFPPTSASYTVVGTTLAGCTNTVIAPLTVFPLPAAGLPADTIICPGEILQVSVPSGIPSWQWSASAPLPCTSCDTLRITPVQPLQIQLRLTDINGCSNIDSMDVDLYPAPVLTVSADTTICAGDSALLRATGMVMYAWTPAQGQQTGAAILVSPNNTTTFSVAGTDANGCMADNVVTVTVQPAPAADAGADLSLFVGQTGTLSGSGGITARWTPPSGLDEPDDYDTQVQAPADSQQYILWVADAFGCYASDTIWVYTLTPERPIVPNAFTPNGDGNNDFFNVPNLQYYDLLELQVYNRWGAMVFSTNNNLPGWDGTIGGQPAPMDTYMYRVILRSPYGLTLQQSGNVLLLR